MNIILLQTDIGWRAPRANMKHAAALIGKAAAGSAVPVDLVVLPEMFTTGFDLDPVSAEGSGTLALEWMRGQASRYDAAVAGSVIWEEEGLVHNRLLFVKPDGNYIYYDKRHLFTFAGENKRYTPGGSRVVVTWRGMRILLQVCYDLRFPVFARNRNDYDMILYVANWPQVRMNAWDTLLKARAIENACYVAGVNRCGSDPSQDYTGGSAIIDFKGHVMAHAGGNEASIEASTDMEALIKFRKKFPVLDDADDFTLA